MYAIYARQSIERQDSVSLDAQIAQCKNSIPNVSDKDIRIYKDAGFSGKNINRPKFEELLQDIKNGNIDFVLSYRLDRISRSITDFASLLSMFEKHNVKYISATEQFDTSSPMGRAMIYIVMVFAQLERETIAERITDNYHYRAKNGGFMGGNTPFGYSSNKISIEGKKVSVLVEDENAFLLKKIFEKFLSGESVYAICRSLNGEGFRTAKGNLWGQNAIVRILKNISPCPNDLNIYNYLVEKNYIITNQQEDYNGKNGMCVFLKNKNRNKETEVEQQLAVIGLHKPIISSDQFIKAQKILSQNSLPHKKKSQKSCVAGLLKCAECGRSFGFKETNRKDKRYAYYYCRGREKTGICTNNLFAHADVIEKSIVRECKIYIADFISNNTKAVKNVDQTDHTTAIKIQIDNIISNIGKGNAVVDELLTSKLTALQTTLNELKAKPKDNIINIDDYINLQKQLNSFDILPIDKRTSLLRGMIKKADININGDINISFNF